MKTTCKWGGLITLLLVLLATSGAAQPHPPQPFGGPLFDAFPLLTQYPPLSTGMPYDVLLGYIGGDSIVRHASENLVRTTTKSLTYADTAKYAAKFIYEMTDYDPVTFFRWCYTQPTSGMYSSGGPGFVRGKLFDRLNVIFPKNLNFVPLLTSDYIAHVKVTETVTSTDTTASRARTAVLVTSYILDTIKGRRVPFCLNEQFKSKGNSEVQLQGAYGACINWDYRLEWQRLNHTGKTTHWDSTFVDSQGGQWVEKHQEYIVFLRFISLRRDSEYNYATLIPVTGWGSCGGMYPIVNGVVYDPYNDFGYGTNLTVAQFKAALRGNINAITHP